MFLRHVEHVILPESHKREKGLYISPLIAFLTPLTQISGKKKKKQIAIKHLEEVFRDFWKSCGLFRIVLRGLPQGPSGTNISDDIHNCCYPDSSSQL